MENGLETTKSDYLSRVLLVTNENGKYFSEKEITNNIIGLIFASYETTSSAFTFVLKYLAELPHIYDKVFQGICISANVGIKLYS